MLEGAKTDPGAMTDRIKRHFDAAAVAAAAAARDPCCTAFPDCAAEAADIDAALLAKVGDRP